MIRSALGLAGVTLPVLALSSGCAYAGAPKHMKELDVSIAHVDAEMLHVEAFNGSISIGASEGDVVAIHAKVYGPDLQRVDSAVVRAERDAEGTLRVWSEWASEPKGNEGVAISVLIPSTAGIHADTSNGAITIASLAGPYTLDTSNGSIEVEQATGDVRADTSNGNVTINGAPGKVVADTSNGSIHITGATGPITSDSSNGNIELVLAEANAGPVIADTSNGSITLIVGPAFAGSLVADTSNGKVRFGPFPQGFSAAVTEVEDDTLRATFGNAEHKSRLDTSNGAIVVKASAGG